MEVENRVVYRDAFLGMIQRHKRVLQPIRFPMVINLCRSSTAISFSALKDLLQAVYCDRGSITILAQTQQKAMIMFSSDEDATLAYQELHGQTIEDAYGPFVQFKIWNPMDDLGYDVADHHVYVSISGLPMHLWKIDVVEQILHPFCALGHLSEETKTRRNLSSYTAFAWSQRRIKMPRRMYLKVTRDISGDDSLRDTEYYKEVSVYTLLIDAVGFLSDTATECSCNLEDLNVRYESAYDPDNAQCFLTESPDNKDLLDELNYAVVASTASENHGYQKEEIQDAVASYLGCDMRVHRINENQFIIMPPDRSVGQIAKEILLEKGSLNMSLTEFNLHHWKPNINSVMQRLSVKANITVNDIPAHLCTQKIMHFVLSPYCAPQSTTMPHQALVTSESFTCTVWTDSMTKIPTRIMAALFLAMPDAEYMEGGYETTTLRITQLIIEASQNQVHQEN